jgi:hypothetical protein
MISVRRTSVRLPHIGPGTALRFVVVHQAIWIAVDAGVLDALSGA